MVAARGGGGATGAGGGSTGAAPARAQAEQAAESAAATAVVDRHDRGLDGSWQGAQPTAALGCWRSSGAGGTGGVGGDADGRCSGRRLMPRREQRRVKLLQPPEIAELDAVLVLQPVEPLGLPVVHEEQNDRGDDRKAPAEDVE